VTNLTAGVTLQNATGADEHGNPVVQWIGTLAPNSSMVFTLQYYTKQRGTVPAAMVVASLSLEDPSKAIKGAVLQIIGFKRVLSTESYLIEFVAVPGRTYHIQYKTLLTDTWKTVQPPIFAPANRIQWIDSGPPGTESAPLAPGTGSRIYQVIEALQ
jgi:hypothetical protein